MSLFHEKNATVQRSQPENLQKHAAGAKLFFIIFEISYKRYRQTSGPNTSYQIKKKKIVNVSSHFQYSSRYFGNIFFNDLISYLQHKRTKTKEP